MCFAFRSAEERERELKTLLAVFQNAPKDTRERQELLASEQRLKVPRGSSKLLCLAVHVYIVADPLLYCLCVYLQGGDREYEEIRNRNNG